jgi:hypothetical protein
VLCAEYAVLEIPHTHQGFVCPSTTCNNTDHATNRALDDLLGTRWQFDTGFALVGVVANDGHVVARCPAQSTSVANLLLDVGDHSTLRYGAKWEHVADCERGVLAGVNELASVHALVGDEGLGVELVAVGIAEGDFGEWCATTWVVDDLLHYTTDIAMTLGEIVGAELRGCFVESFAMLLVHTRCAISSCISRG